MWRRQKSPALLPQLEWQDSEKLVNTAVSSHPSLGHWRQRIWVIIKVFAPGNVLAKNCGFRQSLFLFSSVSKTGSLSVVLDPQENYGCIDRLWPRLHSLQLRVGPAAPWLCPGPTHINHFNEVHPVILVKSMANQAQTIRTRCWMESIILWWVKPTWLVHLGKKFEMRSGLVKGWWGCFPLKPLFTADKLFLKCRRREGKVTPGPE